MEILRTENLTKYYSGKPAINDVSLTLTTGRIYGLLGPNGSGKSTFMRAVAGICNPAKGTITIDGRQQDVESKAAVAYMPTESYFYNYMSIKDIKEYYTDFFDDFNSLRFLDTLQFMQLDEKMKIKNLSSGMNAKLRVALTMSRDAKLYMLDEPLNGIDLIAREAIMSTIISQLSDRNAILLSSHLIGAIEQIVDRVIFIKMGNIVVDEDAEKIREEKSESIMGLYREVFAL